MIKWIVVALTLAAFPTFAAVDYTKWKLTLPVDANGGFTGTAMEIKPLTADFQYPPYYANQIYSAPTNGATTSGSHYPRTELRELINGVNAAWKPSQYSKLAATLQVLEVPTKLDGKPGRIVIGQIHGQSNELCRLYYDKGQLYFYDDKSGSSRKETKFILKDAAGNYTNIPLGYEFTYYIIVEGGKLKVSALYNGIKYSASETISSYWTNDSLYYKAGVYVQASTDPDAGTQGIGSGTAKFTDIRVLH